MLVRVLCAGVAEPARGAIESTVMSTNTDSLLLPARSWIQISRAFSPWTRVSAADHGPEPKSTLRVPLIQTPVSSSRVPVMVTDAEVDVFTPGRTWISPLVTVPPMPAGSGG